MAGDHNWVAIAFARRVVCYSFNEAIGWTLRYVSPTVPADIEHVAISNKFGEIGAKMVAVSYGPTVRLFACGSGEGSRYAEGGGRQSISGLGNHQKKKKKKEDIAGPTTVAMRGASRAGVGLCGSSPLPTMQKTIPPLLPGRREDNTICRDL